jgi:hypothetical protein
MAMKRIQLFLYGETISSRIRSLGNWSGDGAWAVRCRRGDGSVGGEVVRGGIGGRGGGRRGWRCIVHFVLPCA